MSLRHRLSLALVATATTVVLSSPARADEPAPQAPAPALVPPPPRPDRSPHEIEASAARDRLEAIELETRIERAQLALDHVKQLRAAPRKYSSAALGRGSVILPNIVGVSTLPLAGASITAGAGAIGGIGVTSPVFFGFSSGEGGSKSSYIGLSPSIDIFVTDRLTVGARVTAARSASTSILRSTVAGTTTTIGSSGSEGYVLSVAPRVGYLVPLTEGVALWPQIGVTYGQSRAENDGSGRTLARSFGAEIEAGLLLPVARHVLVRVAPTLAYGYTWADATGVFRSEDTDSVHAGVRAEIGLAF